MGDPPERINLRRLKWACREYNDFFRRENKEILRDDAREEIIRGIVEYADFLKEHLTKPNLREFDLKKAYDLRKTGFVEDDRFDYDRLFGNGYADLTEDQTIVRSRIIDLFERNHPLVRENGLKTPLKNKWGIGYADLDIRKGVDEEGQPIYIFNEIDELETSFQRALVRSFVDNIKVDELDNLSQVDIERAIKIGHLFFLPNPEIYKMFEPHGLRLEHDKSFVERMNRSNDLTEEALSRFIVDRYVINRLQKERIRKIYSGQVI
jgi:hypothetical protein